MRWGQTGRRDGGPQLRAPHPGGVELRPLARGRRGGLEALALTSRGPAGDGGSGHSTPNRPPLAPADSSVRRQCARGGASQLRERGSGREPGVSTVGALGQSYETRCWTVPKEAVAPRKRDPEAEAPLIDVTVGAGGWAWAEVQGQSPGGKGECLRMQNPSGLGGDSAHLGT